MRVTTAWKPVVRPSSGTARQSVARRSVTFGAVLALIAVAAVSSALAQGAPVTRAPPPVLAALATSPMNFFVAKGAADACGPGCSEWISADGQFDPGAAGRFQAFLNRVNGYRLPVFFNSPGGLQPQAFAMGRLMRAKGMTAGVGKTVPRDCVPVADKAKANRKPKTNEKVEAGRAAVSCEALKRSGRPVPSDLQNIAACSSACVYALFGAKVRLVPPGARLGVHSGKLVRLYSDGRIEFARRDNSNAGTPSNTAIAAKLRSYVREMGIDPAIMDVVTRVPFEQVHWLSRDEIARFGIDGRDFEETRWTSIVLTPEPPSVIKAVHQVKGEGHDEHRISLVQLACGGADRISIGFFRGLGSRETALTNVNAPKISLASEGKSVILAGPSGRTRLVWFDSGAMFDVYQTSSTLDFFEAAAGQEVVDLFETDPWNVTSARRIRLSTSGLAPAIEALRQQCAKTP
jgi:hypothetical protein